MRNKAQRIAERIKLMRQLLKIYDDDNGRDFMMFEMHTPSGTKSFYSKLDIEKHLNECKEELKRELK